MQKMITVMFTLVLICTLFAGIPVKRVHAETASSKVIAIVVDDSNSMIFGDHYGDAIVDGYKELRWSKAFYSIMAFQQMMDQGDELLVYGFHSEEPMYSKTISGDESTDKLKKDLMKTTFVAGTPPTGIENADRELANNYADKETHLLIITDGNFTGGVDSNSVVRNLQCEDIRYIGISPYCIFPNEGENPNLINHYFENDDSVISNILGVANAIYDRIDIPDENPKDKFEFIDVKDNGQVTLKFADHGIPVSNVVVYYYDTEGTRLKAGENNKWNKKKDVPVESIKEHPTWTPDAPDETRQTLEREKMIEEELAKHIFSGSVLNFSVTDPTTDSIVLKLDGTKKLKKENLHIYYKPAVRLAVELSAKTDPNPVFINGNNDEIMDKTLAAAGYDVKWKLVHVDNKNNILKNTDSFLLKNDKVEVIIDGKSNNEKERGKISAKDEGDVISVKLRNERLKLDSEEVEIRIEAP